MNSWSAVARRGGYKTTKFGGQALIRIRVIEGLRIRVGIQLLTRIPKGTLGMMEWIRHPPRIDVRCK